jgi:hypothetical protein
MSGNSRESYKSSFTETTKGFTAEDPEVRRKAEKARAERLREARFTTDVPKEKPMRDTSGLFDEKLVKLVITRPARGVKKVHIILVDNSGSNRKIADHLKNSSGYLTGALGLIDPQSQVAFIYFSDHCDGSRIMQEVDFISPDQTGDKILYSTLQRVYPADGGDAPEAIECALWKACQIDFGDAVEKHLYLVTDVVGHGMGLEPDHGCPEQRSWQRSVEKVGETFNSFTIVGCSDDKKVAQLQHQFLAPDRVAFDLIDLSAIPEHRHRLAISGNALLFLVARHASIQAVEMFLAFLYEKWLTDPIFGANTDLRAQEAIRRFGKYLELPDEEIEKMMKKILA